MFYLYRESNLKQLATLEISDGMEPKAVSGKKLVEKIILVKTMFLSRPQNLCTKHAVDCNFDFSSARNGNSRFGNSTFDLPNIENSRYGLLNIENSTFGNSGFGSSRFGNSRLCDSGFGNSRLWQFKSLQCRIWQFKIWQ